MRKTILAVLLVGLAAAVAQRVGDRRLPRGRSNADIIFGVQLFASNQLAPSSVTLTGSPFSYTNDQDYSVMVFIGGGTVTAFRINGGVIANGLNFSGVTTLELQADEWLTVSYTNAPTVSWKPL